MMKSGIVLKQGDIVLVPFPFSDLSSTKRRPGFVISNNDYNKRGEDIVICGMTSNPITKEYSTPITNEDLISGNLITNSRIKVDKLFTVKKAKIVKNLATVSEETLNRVKNEMIRLFDF